MSKITCQEMSKIYKLIRNDQAEAFTQVIRDFTDCLVENLCSSDLQLILNKVQLALPNYTEMPRQSK